jgi:hypothetical protein
MRKIHLMNQDGIEKKIIEIRMSIFLKMSTMIFSIEIYLKINLIVCLEIFIKL